MRVPGLLVAALWAATVACIVADTVVKSETSWVADLIRDLTRLFIGLGVAFLIMWHHERTTTRQVDPEYATRLSEYLVRTTLEFRDQLESGSDADVIQLPTQPNGTPMGWRTTGTHRN